MKYKQKKERLVYCLALALAGPMCPALSAQGWSGHFTVRSGLSDKEISSPILHQACGVGTTVVHLVTG